MHASTICMLNMFSTVVQPKTIDFPISEKKMEETLDIRFCLKYSFITSLRNVSSCRNYAIVIYILQLLDTY